MVVNIALRMVATVGLARFAARFIQIENTQEDPEGLSLFAKDRFATSESKAFVLNLVGLVKGSILAIGSNLKAESAGALG